MPALWLVEQPLVLASRSAVRRAMLEAAGIPLEIAPADIDERAVERRVTSMIGQLCLAHSRREKAISSATAWRSMY